MLTPRGEAALAVVRIEGADAGEALARLGVAPPAAAWPTVSMLAIGALRETVVVVACAGGYEVSLHGNPFLVDAVLVECGGASPPAPSSLRDEILESASLAPSRVGLVVCLAQLRLLPTLACDLHEATAADLAARCDQALEAGDSLRRWFRPARVVLRGPTNAGKSTLFNLLVGRERARTGPDRGLTRDPVEEAVVLATVPAVLVDTAGEPGEVGDDLASRALLAGRAEQAEAALVVDVCSAIDVGSAARAGVRVWTHADRGTPQGARKGEPVLDLLSAGPVEIAALGRFLAEALGGAEPPATTVAWVTLRQRELLLTAQAALGRGDALSVAEVGRRLLEP